MLVAEISRLLPRAMICLIHQLFVDQFLCSCLETSESWKSMRSVLKSSGAHLCSTLFAIIAVPGLISYSDAFFAQASAPIELVCFADVF